MKRNHLLYIALLLAGAGVCTSCQKSFLDVKPKGTNLETNYYQNADQLFAALVSVYDPLGSNVRGSYSDKLGIFNAGSDDCYAGGGSSSDVPQWQAINNYTLDAANGPQADLWGRNYTGISRANTFLSNVDQVPGVNAATKARYTAEVKFLRAYYYFDLVREFAHIPLITGPVASADYYNQKQADPADVYAQIEKDLNEAIPDLPVTVPAATEGGRITQGAAKALLGKVILTGNDNSRMQEAASILEDVNKPGNAYGYQLLANYGDIFSPANKFNSESIFEIVHTSVANNSWGNWPNFEGNVAVQMFGARSYTGPTYEAGWGFCPLTMELVNALKGDPRYDYTVANIDSLQLAGDATYSPGYQNTGYFIKKYAPTTQWKSTGGGNIELNYPNDVIEIRLADTYLMEAEALVRGNGDMNKAQYYLDQVRARVGLPSVPATLDNIYHERRLELATEGHRWFDLVRTGQAASALAFKGFTANKNEVLPIPLNELNNTKLVQNDGY